MAHLAGSTKQGPAEVRPKPTDPGEQTVHLRVEENRCGQPHCRTCNNQPPRKPRLREYVGLALYCAFGAGLLVMLVVALVWPRG